MEISVTNNMDISINRLTDKEWNQIYEEIFTIIREDVKNRFETSPEVTVGGYVFPGNIYWKHLSELYLKNRPDRLGNPIYIDTERLKNSLIMKNAPESIAEIRGNTLIYGSDVPYFEKLNEMRVIVILYKELLDKINNQIQNMIINLLLDKT